MKGVTIGVDVFDNAYTIVFRNNARGGIVETWLLNSPVHYHGYLHKLAKMPHIEVIDSGQTIIKDGSDL